MEEEQKKIKENKWKREGLGIYEEKKMKENEEKIE